MKKNDVIASEINDKNNMYSMLQLKILSAIKFVRSKKKTREDIESIYDHLMKTNASNLGKSSTDEVLDYINRFIGYDLVSNK